MRVNHIRFKRQALQLRGHCDQIPLQQTLPLYRITAEPKDQMPPTLQGARQVPHQRFRASTHGQRLIGQQDFQGDVVDSFSKAAAANPNAPQSPE